MKKKIYKYDLDVTDIQVISLPLGSEILTVQTQFDIPRLWALVDPNELDTEERTIEIFGTGQDVHYDMGIDRKYISTFQMHAGNLVFHAFERTN